MYDKFFCKNINIYIIIYIYITLICFLIILSYYTMPFQNIVGIFLSEVTIIRK